jgi:hypothetical protein
MVDSDIMEIRNSVVQRRKKLKQGEKLAFSLMRIRDKLDNIMGDVTFDNEFQDMLDDPFITIIKLNSSTLKSLFGDEYYTLSHSEIDYIIKGLHDKLSVNYCSTLVSLVDEVKARRK